MIDVVWLCPELSCSCAVIKNKFASHLSLWRHVEIWVFGLSDSCCYSEVHILLYLWIPVPQLLFCRIFKSLSSNILGGWVLLLSRLKRLLSRLNVCPLKFICTLVLPHVNNILSKWKASRLFLSVYFCHSNLTFLFMPTDGSLFNRPLQVFFVRLESGPVVVARSGWAEEVSDSIPDSRFGRTWSQLMLV